MWVTLFILRLLALVALGGSLTVAHVRTGRLSYYYPNDGHNAGRMACGGLLRHDSMHIAVREWRYWGCGRRVIVCSHETARCALSYVWDGGPYGAVKGPMKNAVAEGRWAVWTKRPPPGWRYRAVADLGKGLWKQLGKPRGLSRITVYFLKK